MAGATLAAALEREHREIDTGIAEYVGGHDLGALQRAMAALRRHIYLEEEFLFPPLREAGLVAPLFVMVREHGQLWQTMQELDAALAADATGDSALAVCRELTAQLDVAVACAAAPYAVLLAIPPVLVLQRALLVASLREAARTDAKTGLANSTYWREVADREISRARSGQEQVAVLLVDIDHFKGVNDRYGHLVGDDVLRTVAHGLTYGLRPRDFVGRFGGEEFVVLLAGSDLDQARHTAERIRAHVANLMIDVPVRADPVRVTVSVGVAAFRQSGHSINELLDAADSALYSAKHAGRNCVRVAEGARQQVLDLTGSSMIDLRSGVAARRTSAE